MWVGFSRGLQKGDRIGAVRGRFPSRMTRRGRARAGIIAPGCTLADTRINDRVHSHQADLPVDRDAAWPGFRYPALVRAVFLGGPVRRAGTPSARFLLADESLLDLVGVAGEGIIGLEHREPTPVIPAASSCCPNEPAPA